MAVPDTPSACGTSLTGLLDKPHPIHHLQAKKAACEEMFAEEERVRRWGMLTWHGADAAGC